MTIIYHHAKFVVLSEAMLHSVSLIRTLVAPEVGVPGVTHLRLKIKKSLVKISTAKVSLIIEMRVLAASQLY